MNDRYAMIALQPLLSLKEGIIVGCVDKFFAVRAVRTGSMARCMTLIISFVSVISVMTKFKKILISRQVRRPHRR